jgi:chemotaxis protein methyltransferase CheR
MSAATISEGDFLRFKEFFYRKTGMMFDNSKRYFVDKRLIERIEQTETEHFRGYFNFLRFEASGDELQLLVNSMTVNETYFFREEYQFQCLVYSLLDEITKTKTDNSPIRIWSVPSSSGEEPYSIAIYLLEHWAGIEQWDIEIMSSDIDTKIIEQAERGRYSPRSIQHLPKKILTKYFEYHPKSESYQICDDLRNAVTFSRVNIMDPIDVRPYRNIDVIFCRNLLIYFDDTSRRQAAEMFFDAMKPGGFVCLGHSESMSRISSLFRVRKFPEAIVYQKP